ncbi:endonuclease [Epilithonimonas hungarica]|uniref:Por secretion system C-terminal sorting domain-containing protein n=1 Tax=Epilithonimonas hungarica TaxID=454006 RepID=A0A1G7J996_9FLAO|nr:endonuclease [Epilithonimonas hungarica]SDF21547.1 Por secretion system C-terminal sorting domain-containing protein [Epilithonimonas hungarica]
MLKKYLFAFAVFPAFISAQAPEGYYSGTENLTGYMLKTKLHDIISTKTYNWNYEDLKTLYGQTDIDKYYDYDASNTTYLLDIYSNNPTGTTAYHYTLNNIIGSANAEGLGWNREHMMPQSSFNSAYPMYSDLFFVIPTDARINQLRSNYPYGKAGSTVYYNFTNGSKQAANGTPNATYTGRVFEPIDEFKGDIARSLLYFAVRYEGKLGSFNYTTNAADPTKDQNPLDGTEEKSYENWYIAMLLNWHQLDPVSQREIDRNNSVFNIQKNRNPFIDHPEWANLIWNQTPDNIAPAAPSSLMLERNSAYFVNLAWQANTEPDVLGYKIYQDGVLIGTSKTNSFSADHLVPDATYNFTVKAYDNAYLESPQSNTLNITTLSTDGFAKDLQIVKYLEGTGNNKAFEIANRTGHKVNLNGYKLYIQYKGTAYYFGEPFELEGEIENDQSFVVINPNANFSCFNVSNAKFVTAAPSLTFSGSNYVDLSYKSGTVDAIGIKGQDNANANKSLYRNSNTINPTATFDISEWTTYASDYCQGLGILAVNDIVNCNPYFNIYPNPVVDRINITGDVGKAKSAQIYDLSGKLIKNIHNPFIGEKSIDVHSLLPNTYILNIDGKSIKFIKK